MRQAYGRTVGSARNGLHRRGERNAAAWATVNRVLAVLVVGAVLVALALWITPELVRRAELAAELEAKKTELAREVGLRKKREREKFLIENDPEYVETIARDKLDLMKEGETIFRLDSIPPPASPPPGN
jgi:cell division protein FtsB